MWIILLIVLMAAAAIHSKFGKSGTPAPELFLVYLLAGYCGIAPIAMGVAMLVASPEWQLAHLPRVQPGNPVMTWFAFLWIGMGAIGALSIRFRGTYLIAPLVGWTIFWAGGNLAHIIHDPSDGHPLTVHGFLHLFVAHGLIALLLVGFGVAMWRRTRPQR